MEFHSVANIFPMMSDAELQELANDIKAHGLLEPIITWQEKILDGRNRYIACNLADVQPDFAEWKDGSDPVAFVVSKNLKRRHLTREQRDEVIRRLREQGMTLQKIADSVGVSHQTAMRAINSDCPNGQSEIVNERGQVRPTHYSERQDDTQNGEDDEDDDPIEGDMHYAVYDEFGSQTNYTVAPDEELVVIKKDVPHVAHNSGNNEWYTPQEYIDRAVTVMGGIDLDPASTEVANAVIKANKFYTAQDDGLVHEWRGRVWMNPPYASELIGQFVDKLLASPEVTHAIVLVNNATETKWFQSLAGKASAVCFPSGRVRFWNPEKESATPLQGQAVLYIGDDARGFCKAYSDLGTIWRK